MIQIRELNWFRISILEWNLDQFSSWVHSVAVGILVPIERKKKMMAWRWQSEATSEGFCQD